MTELDEDYARAGFNKSLGFGERPVLLVIDFVMAYLDPDSPLHAGVEAELKVNEKLVAAAREAGVPVIWTNVEYEPGGADGGHFYRKIAALKVFDRGSPLGAFPPSLQPAPGERIVTKQYPSAFFGTGFAETLRAMDVDCCVITGLSTSGCVRASTLDALQHGFIPLVVPEACGDRDAAVHDANIFDLRAKYADMLSVDETLAYFSRLSA
ncbi:isochorismatase family protein [Parasphingopyxis algicola]|uniref:isochorismatase family protein n=1 Tax=Parasphingopyxis algicola TaxID=2026624 RepID=UPI0015A3DA1C|nr:isochorismatase family protein [Parasphingopyxis algicola]QLC25382.1 isochorismatase family protein [Parasphingopyxis algicola]